MISNIVRHLKKDVEALELFKQGELQLAGLSEVEARAIRDVFVSPKKLKDLLDGPLWL